LSVSSKSIGATFLDLCSGWMDAARKALRPFVPTAVYYRLAALYNLGMGAHKVGWGTYLRLQRLSRAAARMISGGGICFPPNAPTSRQNAAGSILAAISFKQDKAARDRLKGNSRSVFVEENRTAATLAAVAYSEKGAID
jgi:hypothetical protein